MRKIVGIILALLFILIIAIVNKEPVQSKTQQETLSELQIEACNSADTAKTCDTRLPELGIVLKEECCEALGKCC